MCGVTSSMSSAWKGSSGYRPDRRPAYLHPDTTPPTRQHNDFHRTLLFRHVGAPVCCGVLLCVVVCYHVLLSIVLCLVSYLYVWLMYLSSAVDWPIVRPCTSITGNWPHGYAPATPQHTATPTAQKGVPPSPEGPSHHHAVENMRFSEVGYSQALPAANSSLPILTSSKSTPPMCSARRIISALPAMSK